MRKAAVFFKDEEAGVLIQHDDATFTFSYHKAWLTDIGKPDISLSLPKKEQVFTSAHLFPFFYNMLPEGINKQNICKHLRIDANDHFGLLMAIAKADTIGAVSVLKLDN